MLSYFSMGFGFVLIFQWCCFCPCPYFDATCIYYFFMSKVSFLSQVGGELKRSPALLRLDPKLFSAIDILGKHIS